MKDSGCRYSVYYCGASNLQLYYGCYGVSVGNGSLNGEEMASEFQKDFLWLFTAGLCWFL